MDPEAAEEVKLRAADSRTPISTPFHNVTILGHPAKACNGEAPLADEGYNTSFFCEACILTMGGRHQRPNASYCTSLLLSNLPEDHHTRIDLHLFKTGKVLAKFIAKYPFQKRLSTTYLYNHDTGIDRRLSPQLQAITFSNQIPAFTRPGGLIRRPSYMIHYSVPSLLLARWVHSGVYHRRRLIREAGMFLHFSLPGV